MVISSKFPIVTVRHKIPILFEMYMNYIIHITTKFLSLFVYTLRTVPYKSNTSSPNVKTIRDVSLTYLDEYSIARCFIFKKESKWDHFNQHKIIQWEINEYEGNKHFFKSLMISWHTKDSMIIHWLTCFARCFKKKIEIQGNSLKTLKKNTKSHFNQMTIPKNRWTSTAWSKTLNLNQPSKTLSSTPFLFYQLYSVYFTAGQL